MEHPGNREGKVNKTDWHIRGSSEEVRRLHTALNRLSDTDSGRSISEEIRKRGTALRFGQIEGEAVAYFNPERNQIVINTNLQNASPEILAAHLAHEGTHVQWNREDSINQEYHAFRVQTEVWSQLKGDKADLQCDFVRWMISLGEKDAKRIIRRHYPDLPEVAYRNGGDSHESAQLPDIPGRIPKSALYFSLSY